MQRVPRVAAVHDMSCFGRCSLTVIMPILAAMGVQVCPLPTAVLSTHLGGFHNLAFHDFTDMMPAFFRHWQEEGVQFDCIYSGFLASTQQISVVEAFIREFSHNRPLVVVDPVMGDEGKLYSIYTPQLQEKMKELVKQADIITPNYTEACFLLGEAYTAPLTEMQHLDEWLERLAALGPSKVVMTGIPLAGREVVNLGYDAAAGQRWQITNQHIPARYPGTGDAFASVLAGALLQGQSLPAAMQQAADFVALAIKETYQAGTPPREGVLLERVLPALWQQQAGTVIV